MNFKRNIKIILIYILSIFIFQLDVHASSHFSLYEKQITPTSSEVKIEKLQKLFKDLGLYNGEIDGRYESIEGNLVEYQINNGLITTGTDWGAGYFGEKTMILLEEDYGDRFHELAEEYIKNIPPELGKRTFIVTAYYSPSPNQNKYSYNVLKKRQRTYVEEIRLQGKGKITASGKGVFSGLIAAPKNYFFGTKIKLDGIGVGDVQDRGGAIVNSGERGYEYDRIDIWMGYGDEGLQRAIKWGKREVNGEIVLNNTPTTIEFDESPVAKYDDLTLDAENPVKENVEKLQNLLTDVGLYNGEVDGNFENIKNTLIEFQINNGIIESSNSDEAGYFGKKTIAVLREKYGGNIFKKIDIIVALSLEKKKRLQKIKDLLQTFIDKKAKGDKGKNDIYILKLKTNIEKYIIKTKDNTKKQQLLYLNSIL